MSRQRILAVIGTFIISVLLGANSVNAQSSTCSYYVSPNGDNSSGRSPAQAFGTITAGVNALTASSGNNILCIGSGNYNERVEIEKSGSSNFPLIIRAENPNNPPKIDGRVGQNGPGSGLPEGADRLCDNLPPYYCHSDRGLIQVQGNFITIDGLEILNSRGRGISVGHPDKPTITNIIIQNNHIHEVYHSLITFDKVNNSKIHHNLAYRGGLFAPHPRLPSQVNWGAAIALRISNNIQITGNILHSAWNDGIIFDGQDGNSSYITVTDNYIYNIWRYMIYAHGSHHSNIERNFVFNTDDSQYLNPDGSTIVGIAVTNTETQSNFENIRSINITVANNIVANRERNIAVGSSTDVRVVQNTLINSAGNDKASLTIVDDPNNIRITNNLIYQPRASSLLFAGSTNSVAFSHNYWNRNPIATASSPNDVIAADPGLLNPNTTLIVPTNINSWQAQRDYISNLAKNFALKAQSPLINQGMTTTSSQDFFNNVSIRPQGTQFDIGADEFGDSNCSTNCGPTPTQPPEPTPTGTSPNWYFRLTRWFQDQTNPSTDGIFNIIDWLSNF